ncbi:hypothetical protein DQ04_00331050 [Trypanosoma grayi]|uniref:hypothetical protein n=1 Tax=Trypanosoma grayi TaxID=71804 RepID=UPI0004F3EFC1|nr:hypothetical protein DQ04_00331050 [Trypanosoma grayi]KEG14712.1 hypothetical protein DQ04_00331050 [Trypanosoma grayi]
MLRQRLRDARQDDLAEAAEVARSLYPAGCAVPEYVNALQTCAAMLSSTVPSHTVARFAEHRVADLVAQGRETVTADELLSDLIERPLLDAVTPPQWWLSDAECAGAASVKSVRLRAQPTQILIVYDWCGRLRHRRIHLAGVLHENGPTAPLAKRLARVHGALIKEERFLAYLLRLQGLMKESAVHSGKGSASDAVLTQTQGCAFRVS